MVRAHPVCGDLFTWVSVVLILEQPLVYLPVSPPCSSWLRLSQYFECFSVLFISLHCLRVLNLTELAHHFPAALPSSASIAMEVKLWRIKGTIPATYFDFLIWYILTFFLIHNWSCCAGYLSPRPLYTSLPVPHRWLVLVRLFACPAVKGCDSCFVISSFPSLMHRGNGNVTFVNKSRDPYCTERSHHISRKC